MQKAARKLSPFGRFRPFPFGAMAGRIPSSWTVGQAVERRIQFGSSVERVLIEGSHALSVRDAGSVDGCGKARRGDNVMAQAPI